jgi:hypothetical protein
MPALQKNIGDVGAKQAIAKILNVGPQMMQSNVGNIVENAAVNAFFKYVRRKTVNVEAFTVFVLAFDFGLYCFDNSPVEPPRQIAKHPYSSDRICTDRPVNANDIHQLPA